MIRKAVEDFLAKIGMRLIERDDLTWAVSDGSGSGGGTPIAKEHLIMMVYAFEEFDLLMPSPEELHAKTGRTPIMHAG